MLQIISNSNETSTGPELVQNGNFSQLGADLVENGLFDQLGTDVITNGNFATDTDWTKGNGWSIAGKAISTQALGSEEVTNGDFSATGINLVDNPNFTDTGADVIYNGDFADTSIALGTTGSGWSLPLGLSEYTTFGGNTAVKMTRVTTANQLRAKTVGGSNVVSANTSYKLTYTVLENNGVTGFRIFASTSTNIPYDVSATPHVVYFTTTDANVLLQFVNDTNNSDITFTDIVVEELGADWTELSADPDSVSFGENGLTIVQSSDGGTDNRAYQVSVTEADKSYKVTYTIQDAQYTASNRLEYYNGAGYYAFPEQDEGTHTFYYTRKGTNNNWFFNLRTSTTSATDFVTISSISVQELGEDWTVTPTSPSTLSFNADGAFFNVVGGSFVQINQSLSFTAAKSYKLILTYTGDGQNKTFKLLDDSSSLGGIAENISTSSLTPITQTFYFTANTASDTVLFKRNSSGDYNFTINSVSVKEIATSYLTQAVSLSAKTWKIIYSVSDYIAGSVSATDYGAVTTANAVGITEYVQIEVASNFRMVNIDGYFEGAVTDISAQLVDPNGYWTLGTGWTFGEDVAISDGSVGSITQSILTADVFYKIRIKVTGNPTLLVFSSTSFYGDEAARTLKNGTHNYYLQAKVAAFSITNEGGNACTITNISVEQTDPNNYWTLGTGWSIGTDKAISTITSSNSDITQSILTAGKTYRTVYEIVDYDAGTAQAVVTGSAGADAVAIETYTEDLTTTGTDFSIRSKLGTFDGSVSSVSAKLLGSYEDQSIYVTAADVQTLPQASVYYLVELTSMASKNSIYFIPSSVVPNNGRYTKLNFTVVSKDALTQPTVGIISFYDSVGGFDTYPMGFYEFKIYEQTSSTNLDPTLATGLLEKGFAFVRDFSGNMQELTDGFKEYNPTLTQYVYSK